MHITKLISLTLTRPDSPYNVHTLQIRNYFASRVSDPVYRRVDKDVSKAQIQKFESHTSEPQAARGAALAEAHDTSEREQRKRAEEYDEHDRRANEACADRANLVVRADEHGLALVRRRGEARRTRGPACSRTSCTTSGDPRS